MQRNTIIAVVIIIIIGVIIVWSQKKDDVVIPEQAQESSNNNKVANNTVNGTPVEPEAAVRTKVIELGQKMKMVSTTAADFKNQVQLQYGAYVTPSLLETWKTNPTLALAKNNAKLSPDRIEIVSVTKVDANTYKVEGTVVEVGLAGATAGSTYPVTLTVKNDRGSWLVTAVVK
jgi:hypothetical protein